LRLFVLFFSWYLGLFGFFIAFFIIITLLVSLESFGHPYMSSLSKPKLREIIQSFIRIPFQLMKKRNQAYQPIDRDTQKE
jgi:divalent metal cation (Fe/Co/Zn/Cd) transporter